MIIRKIGNFNCNRSSLPDITIEDEPHRNIKVIVIIGENLRIPNEKLQKKDILVNQKVMI